MLPGAGSADTNTMSILTHIQAAIDACFAQLGVAATYTPAGGGDAEDVTVMPSQETEDITGIVDVSANRATFDVRVSELADPDASQQVAGAGTLTVGATDYRIRRKSYTDARQLIWRLGCVPA